MGTLWNSEEIADVWAVADRVTGTGRQKRPFNPPRLTINLSLPSEHRYDHVASLMKQHLDLPNLLNSILDDLTGPAISAILKIPIRLLMRRLHSDEEDAELRGISRATGVPRALLVISRGRPEGTPAGACDGSNSRMLHFRTLDWSGAKLRRIIIELDFVTSEGGPVVARTLAYFGYAGVLTGKLRAAPSTAAYLILCTPKRAYNIEKDHRPASWTSSSHFILTCNNDVAENAEPRDPPGEGPAGNQGKPHSLLSPASSQGMKQMEWTINGSAERKRGIVAVREGLMATQRRRNAREHDLEDRDPHCQCGEGRDRDMTPQDLLVMVKNRPMSNSQTQYAVIMDPLAGAFVWRMAYAEKHRADGGE
ncbi:hypothetical protein INS49_015058 [Diaporthe citri]|uniref:uncharacterized protein n=1 Tax=Diaporthe citri TaxID=83186 RepID=UPI001C808B1B|nr:uncharacterized protein INS49_015058 [Diaporthe citri]KAG6357180.1 hypothetical protein INS49_015058 [Diaporthe citri]